MKTKKLLLNIFAAFTMLLMFSYNKTAAQSVAINTTGTALNTSAGLDVDFTNKGFLVPRMTAAQRAAIVAPATSLLVYQTDAGTLGIGFYFYNGAAWTPFGTNNGGWGLAGNIGTTASTSAIGVAANNNFIGTTDAKDFVFTTNGLERMRIQQGTGNIGIGSIAPAYSFYMLANVANHTLRVENTNSSAFSSVYGKNTAATGAGTGNGVYAYTAQSGGVGLLATNVNAAGTGIVGIGQNSATYSTLVAGSGAAITGITTGLYAFASSVATTGVAGGVFQDGATGSQVSVNAWSGFTHYKVIATAGALPVSCSVPNLEGNMVVLHCPETPEFYFEDYGQGALINGKIHIDIDPILAKNIIISDKHPLRVYIQLEDNENCKGVIVKDKTGTGFDVVELNGGTSNTPFQWHIVCNVKDLAEGNGVVNHTQDLRFEPSPKPAKTVANSKSNQE